VRVIVDDPIQRNPVDLALPVDFGNRQCSSLDELLDGSDASSEIGAVSGSVIRRFGAVSRRNSFFTCCAISVERAWTKSSSNIG
jgi:hypothetical protein